MCCEVEDSSLNVPNLADLEHEVKEYRLIKAMVLACGLPGHILS